MITADLLSTSGIEKDMNQLTECLEATKSIYRKNKIIREKILTFLYQNILYGFGFDSIEQEKYTSAPSLISFGFKLCPISMSAVGASIKIKI